MEWWTLLELRDFIEKITNKPISHQRIWQLFGEERFVGQVRIKGRPLVPAYPVIKEGQRERPGTITDYMEWRALHPEYDTERSLESGKVTA